MHNIRCPHILIFSIKKVSIKESEREYCKDVSNTQKNFTPRIQHNSLAHLHNRRKSCGYMLNIRENKQVESCFAGESLELFFREQLFSFLAVIGVKRRKVEAVQIISKS
jgi:hypothetical protein